jgi:hypothetical protein
VAIYEKKINKNFSAFWKRYPNPYSSHVLSEDTIHREVNNDGKLYSRRLLTKTNKVPNWGKRFFKSGNFVCIIEESVVDPKEKTLTTYTRNIGFNKIMVSFKIHNKRKAKEKSINFLFYFIFFLFVDLLKMHSKIPN